MKPASRVAPMVLAAACLSWVATPGSATVLFEDIFSYPAGNLAGQGGWYAHSGVGAKPIQVSTGRITLQQSAGAGEDVNHPFANLSAKTYLGFTLRVPSGSVMGTAKDYFIHFRPAANDSNNFVTRVFVGPPTAGGDFSLGVGSGLLTTTPFATWPSDLTFNTTYRVVTVYDPASGGSQLWFDPQNESSASINTGSAPTLTNRVLASVAVRQASPTGATCSEQIGQVAVGTTFDDVLPNRAPTVDPLPSVIGIQGTTLRLTPIGRDLDGDPLSWSLQNLPDDDGDIPVGAISPTSGAIAWTLSECEPPGERLAQVVVQDGRGGVGSASVRILVRPFGAFECTVDPEDAFKYDNPAMDADGNFVNDALDALDPGAPDSVDVIVRFTECLGQTAIDSLAARCRIYYLSPYVNIGLIRMVAAQFDPVAAFPFVAFLDPDAPVVGALETSTRAITVRKSAAYSPETIEDTYPELDGSGVAIAFLDTGIDDGVHESLPGWKFLEGGTVVGFLFPFFTPGNPDDVSGHGTHVAAAALGVGHPDGSQRGVAPGASLIDLQTMVAPPGGGAPVGWASVQIMAIDWCIQNWAQYNIRVINIGSVQLNSLLGVNISRSVDRAVLEGIIVVVPAGNTGPFNTVLPIPADTPSALTVGASGHMNTVVITDDGVADFSSRGGPSTTKPEVVAPGTDFPTGGIVSAQFNTASGYVARQGTSVAAAHVSGLAAIFKQALPDMTPDTFRQLLIETADNIGTTLSAATGSTTGRAQFPEAPQLVPARLVNGFRALRRVVVPRADLGFQLYYQKPGPEEWWVTEEVKPTDGPICPLVPNPVMVKVTNFGPNPAVDFLVRAGETENGHIAAEFELGRTTVTDTLQVGQSVTVSFPWLPRQHNRPFIHQCLRGHVSYGGDLNPINDVAQHNVEYGFCSPERHQMKVVNRTRQDVQVTLAHAFVTGTGWTITCSEPSFTFPMLADEVPRYVEFFIRPTSAASDTAAVDIEVMAQTTCGPQSMGGNRLIAVRNHYVDVTDGPRVTSVRVWPNPFSSRFGIQLTLPVRQRVDVDVYDVAGRLVRRLGGYEMPPGESEIVWDGTTQDRSRAGSGLYFVRVRTLDHLETRRVICLR